MPEIKLTGITNEEIEKIITNGSWPDVFDMEAVAIHGAQAQLESDERRANLHLKEILKKLKADLESDSLGLTLEWDNIWQKYIGE